MNMKLVKYMLIAILVLGTGEVAAQVQVVSGKVTEMLGNQIEPIVGANVNIVNAQNRSVGGAVTNLDGDYRLQIPAQENNPMEFPIRETHCGHTCRNRRDCGFWLR